MKKVQGLKTCGRLQSLHYWKGWRLYSLIGLGLENQPGTNDNATVAAVRRPLVEEPARVNRCCWDTKVAGVSRIEHVGTELHANTFSEARVLDDPEVKVPDTVSAEDIATGVTKSLARCCGIGQRAIALQSSEELLPLSTN